MKTGAPNNDALAQSASRSAGPLREHPSWEHWRALSRDAPPFLTAEFFDQTARLTRASVPLVACVGQPPRGAALFLVRRGRVLEALKSDHSPRFDLVGDPAAIPALVDELLRIDGWDLLCLEGVAEESTLCRELPRAATARGCRVAVRASSRKPWFPLDGFEEQLTRKFRRSLYRGARQLGGTFERLEHADRKALDEAYDIEAAAWKGAAGTAIRSSTELVAFYDALALLAESRRQLSLCFLRSGSKRVGVHIAVEDGRTFYLLKPGYNPEYARFGVGHLLVLEAARDARARGLEEFDLLGQEADWKLKWTRRVRPHVTLLVYRPTVRGRIRHVATEVLRPVASGVLRRFRPSRCSRARCAAAREACRRRHWQRIPR